MRAGVAGGAIAAALSGPTGPAIAIGSAAGTTGTSDIASKFVAASCRL
jgi:hypothetical protein